MAITSANQLELLQTAEAVAREKMNDIAVHVGNGDAIRLLRARVQVYTDGLRRKHLYIETAVLTLVAQLDLGNTL